MKKYNQYLSLGIILAIALFLRAYKIVSNFYYSGELGKELLYIKKFVDLDSIPLVGMTTSHEWLSYGPIYYWFMIPIYRMFNGSPFILVWVAILVSLIALVVNYEVVKRLTGQKIALASTLFMAVSPLFIWQTRLAKLHVFFWLIMPLLMYLASKIWDGNRKYLFITGILFGILFSFHFSQIPILVVFLLIFLIKKKLFNFNDYLKFAVGIILPNLTIIWQDIKIFAWVPYRVINIVNKEPSETFASILEYTGKNIFWQEKLWLIGFFLLAVVFIHFVITRKNKLKTDFLSFYLISSVSLVFVANILHGNPPVHYFLPIFTYIPLLVSIYTTKIKYSTLVVLIICLVNINAFTQDPYFYKYFTGNIIGTDFVSFETQKVITSFITEDSKGNEISIKRTGPYDYFPEEYSQNYKYLIFLHGGKINDLSGNKYTIVEDENGVHVKK